MSGPFSALQFLRKIPAPLLSAYFKRFNAVEVAVFGQQFPKSSDLMTFWKTLPATRPEEQQKAILAKSSK